jgi:TonB family protein
MLGEDELPQINLAGLNARSDRKRYYRMLFAFALLIGALAAIVVKYRPFWFDSLSFEQAGNQTTSDAITKGKLRVKPAKSRRGITNRRTPLSSKPETVESSEHSDFVIAPLRIDVTYSSGKHETLLARNSAVNIDMQRDAWQSLAFPAPAPETGVIQAAERVHLSAQTADVVADPVEPVYPRLAQQSRVEGSVVLRVRVNKDGIVQAISVISGPDILTTAALEAVKQWRFKPHYESGEAVPTETRITVNFTISTP